MHWQNTESTFEQQKTKFNSILLVRQMQSKSLSNNGIITILTHLFDCKFSKNVCLVCPNCDLTFVLYYVLLLNVEMIAAM